MPRDEYGHWYEGAGQVKPNKSVSPPKRPADAKPEPIFLVTSKKFMVQICKQTDNTITKWEDAIYRPKSFADALEHAVYIAHTRAKDLSEKYGFIGMNLITDEVRPEIVAFEHNKIVRIHVWYKDGKTGSSELEAFRVVEKA